MQPLRDDTFALFVDMLGFAALTEESPPLDEREYDYASHTGTVVGYPNSLPSHFAAFHREIDHLVAYGGVMADVVYMSFSDCAFIVCDSLQDVQRLAVHLMRRLICSQVPTRMGIGRGDFHRIRFRADTGNRRSNYAAHFVGKAIVRAHAAEHCGVKGMRILLHPTVIVNGAHERVPLFDKPRDTEVSFELNYFESINDPDTKLMLRAVDYMLAQAPEAVRIHYLNTQKALSLMAEQLQAAKHT